STLLRFWRMVISESGIFMISALIVNAGNYLYNVMLGRTVSPEVFAETGLLVTLLLVLSFLGMTFQLVTAKYIVEVDEGDRTALQHSLSAISIGFGVLISLFIYFQSDYIADFFQLKDSGSIQALSFGVACYFYLSVIRGMAQGNEQFIKLSISYQVEMLSRFALTFILIFLLGMPASLSVAVSISISILAGVIPCGIFKIHLQRINPVVIKSILTFFLFTMGYELVQMLTNYFDLILVKHYFSEEMAGLYTALSLIGRMIYFITWMFVMILIPNVINRKKEGKPYQNLLNSYLMYITILVSLLILTSAIFPNLIVEMVFGEEYNYIAIYLWRYALATGLLAIGNILVYYYLSLSNYRPVIIMGVCALLQMIAITFFHSTFQQIIDLQIVFMGLALVGILGYHRFVITKISALVRGVG
ncbi:MAG: oligosaccharide flippase family protein, partial [Bacteroidota bacterium]